MSESKSSVAVRETFSSMKFRNFRLFFTGQMISQIGNWLTLVAQTLLVLKLTHNDGLSIGALAACQFGPVLLLGAWAGVIADRSDKRKLLVIVQSFAMLQSFALAALAFSGSPPVWSIFAVAFAGGIATAFDNPTRRAFVVEMVPIENVQNAVSLNSALMTSSRIFGPALAGLLIVTVGYGWCFLVDGLSYIAVLIGLLMMRPSELRSSPVALKVKGQIREGLRYAKSKSDLWVPLVMMAVVGTLTFNFNVVMPLFVKKTLHGSDTTFTILYSVVSIGSLAGALLTARRTSIAVHDVVVGAALFGMAMCIFAASPGLVTSFPFAILIGFTSIIFMTASTAIVQMRAAPEMRGRVLALQAIVFLGSTPIGGPILGWICDQFGPRTGFLVGGVGALGAAAWGFLADGGRNPLRRRVAALPAAETATVGPITRETPVLH
ncbi:MAG: arabinose efflux permease family protein [Ilumatobacteraceae bacterium]|nr:arabinose efflux permease family protein [Ilumatobacteraceae bacterium]